MDSQGTFIELRIPGPPQGKGRPRTFRLKTGAIVHTTPAKTRTYEGLIASLAMGVMEERQPLQGPIELEATMQMPVPNSWPQWKREQALQGRILPTTKPDCDNALKAWLDGCNGVIWRDDVQVVSVTLRKIYHERACVVLKVRELAGVQSAQLAVRPGNAPVKGAAQMELAA